jgi:dolichol-phosphate mannosyltransferase
MPQLSIIVPTFNERDNVLPMVEALEAALDGVDWEAVFVDDDSPDGTAERVRELGNRNPRVRLIRRIGRKGLTSACIEGMMSSSAPLLAVMDADLQHDESLLPLMLNELSGEGCDIVIGSRYVEGGSSGPGLNRLRSFGSKLGVRLSRGLCGQSLTDPMSGFFMTRREIVETSTQSLYGKGFKILLDMLSSHPGPLRIAELPYRMRPRKAGDSKLDSGIVIDFLLMLLDRKLRGLIPARFLLFLLVGLSGVGVHMGTLYLVHFTLGSHFTWAQAMATWVAMTTNFFLNNSFTFRDRRLRGRELAGGLASFYLACGLGALLNVALASYLFSLGMHWALAGLSGAAAGAVWNFSLSSHFTWRDRS